MRIDKDKKHFLTSFGTWSDKWDNGVTVKLFAKFLKKKHVMHRLYAKLMEDSVYQLRNRIHITSYPSVYAIPSLYIRYGIDEIARDKNDGIPTNEDLVESQLWKFYILKHIDDYPSDLRNGVKNVVKEKLESNGTRGSDKIKHLMEKYGIKVEDT